MKTKMSDVNLWYSAINNIWDYCDDNNCNKDYQTIKKKLEEEAEKLCNTKSINFYENFYQLSIKLLNQTTKK